MNWISDIRKCPKCDADLRVNLEWKEECKIDYLAKTHEAILEILSLELYFKEEKK
jgi:hypothetical protein